MLPAPYAEFRKRLGDFIPEENIYTDPLQTLAYGTDASFYRLIPKIVVDTNTEAEVIGILRLASRMNVPVTFRAAGTSLSGQAVTDSVLVRLSDWTGFAIFDDAKKIRLEPGIIGSHANRLLAEFGRKIGPDPASIDSCKIGGILANNASGMCCGVAENSYKTLHSLRVIMHDGTVLDTAEDKSRAAFMRSHGDLLEGLSALRDKVVENKPLAALIRKKFKIKNTTGYSLNALVDFKDPFQILQHLLVGSEGTLGFISEVTYRTVVEHPHKASALMLFPDIRSACEATQILKKQPVAAVELMDRAALRSVEDKPGMPEILRELDDSAASLLVETRAGEESVLNEQIEAVVEALRDIPCVTPHSFTAVTEEFTKLWNIRKGLFPAVGAVRETGTSVIIEDVAFPMEKLADATLELQALFAKHGYTEAIIFGHALEGNLHFVFTPDMNDPAEVARYRTFMDEVCSMVAEGYKGSLKAEHGTGRNMAPFVEMEWGREAYALMKEIKALFDPKGILNPGVILNEDKDIHVKNLKPLPAADPIVDKCIECGFCEPVCPSRDLSFTPRQRIVGIREISRAEAAHEDIRHRKSLRREYDYLGEVTCATDGLCAMRCPVGINTGSFIKEYRARQRGGVSRKAAAWTAEHFETTERLARTALSAADTMHGILGTKNMTAAAKGLRAASFDAIPLWNEQMPTPAGRLDPICLDPNAPSKAVYFPACISRAMGPARGDRRDDLQHITVSLLRKAGWEVVFPADMHSLCCGQPYESKGFPEQAERKARELDAALLAATGDGELPVICDTSPCLYRMRETLDSRLKLYEPVEFVLEHLASGLDFTKLDRRIALHITCTARKMNLDAKFMDLAGRCAAEVIVPEDIFCCGFAGDRGFSQPELKASALRRLREQVDHCDAGYSTSRTCEIGLSLHGGIPYRSILYLVDEATTRAADKLADRKKLG